MESMRKNFVHHYYGLLFVTLGKVVFLIKDDTNLTVTSTYIGFFFYTTLPQTNVYV